VKWKLALPIILLYLLFVASNSFSLPPQLVKANSYIDSLIESGCSFTSCKAFADDSGSIHLFYDISRSKHKQLYYVKFTPDGKIIIGPKLKIPSFFAYSSISGHPLYGWPLITFNEGNTHILYPIKPLPSKMGTRYKYYSIDSKMSLIRESTISIGEYNEGNSLGGLQSSKLNSFIAMGHLSQVRPFIIYKKIGKNKIYKKLLELNHESRLTYEGGNNFIQLDNGFIKSMRNWPRVSSRKIDMCTFASDLDSLIKIESFATDDSISVFYAIEDIVTNDLFSKFIRLDDRIIFLAEQFTYTSELTLSGFAVIEMDLSGKIVNSDSCKMREPIFTQLNDVCRGDIIMEIIPECLPKALEPETHGPKFGLVSFRSYPDMLIDTGAK
jgi:hypothetical protein